MEKDSTGSLSHVGRTPTSGKRPVKDALDSFKSGSIS